MDINSISNNHNPVSKVGSSQNINPENILKDKTSSNTQVTKVSSKDTFVRSNPKNVTPTIYNASGRVKNYTNKACASTPKECLAVAQSIGAQSEAMAHTKPTTIKKTGTSTSKVQAVSGKSKFILP